MLHRHVVANQIGPIPTDPESGSQTTCVSDETKNCTLRASFANGISDKIFIDNQNTIELLLQSVCTNEVANYCPVYCAIEKFLTISDEFAHNATIYTTQAQLFISLII
jgi:hypothetical protein